MKRCWIAFCLLFLMLVFAGCQGPMKGDLLPNLPDMAETEPAATAKDGNSNTAAPVAEATPVATVQPAVTAENSPTPDATPAGTSELRGPEAVEFEWDKGYANNRELLELRAKDENGKLLWTYKSDSEAAQLSSFTNIGARDGRYYLVDKGSVIALRLDDGSEIWKNEEFGGYSASFAWDDKGRLFLCGYYGPSLFVVDGDGNTVKRIGELDSGYAWAHSISWSDGIVTIHFELDMEDTDNSDTVFHINADTFEVIDSVRSSEWKQAYIDRIEMDYVSGLESMTYRLQDIDGNGIPELYQESWVTASGSQLFTYSRDAGLQVLWMDTMGFSYQEGNNLIRSSGGRMDHYYDEVYRIRNGGFELVISGEYGAEDNTQVQYDSKGDPIYQYFWNGEKVENWEAYEAKLDESFPLDSEHAPLKIAEWDSAKGSYTGDGLMDHNGVLEALR